MIFSEGKAACGADVSLHGAFRSGDTVTFTLSSAVRAVSAAMRIHSDGYEGEVKRVRLEMKKEEDGTFSLTLDTEELSRSLCGRKTGLFYYDYEVTVFDRVLHLGGEEVKVLLDSGEYGERQLLIYSAETKAPPKHGIVYHVFVDRFCKSGRCSVREGGVLNEDWDGGIPQFADVPGGEVANNVFFGGDLYGIIEKLPYIASLGTAIIYLSPVFEAASNHKYDTADYLTVDSAFGGDEALRELTEKAEELGIDVMLDGVFNHTGSDSIYFNKEGRYGNTGAYNSTGSPYYRWYNFKNYPDEYECWWGVKILPRVDSTNETYRSFITREVVPKWTRLGVKHWRLDVADELSDAFLSDLADSVPEDSLVIGEVWEDASDKVSYGRRRRYFTDGQLTSVMNYPLRSAIISYILHGDTESLRHATEGLYRRYPKHVSDNLLNFLGTHDTERALTVFGDDDYFALSNAELSTRRMTDEGRAAAKKKLLEAYAMITALPGIPCVFYGDEAGLEGYRDPFCRMPFPWGREDAELTEKYRELGNFRKNEEMLADADFEIVSLTEESFVFTRRRDGEKLTAYINNTDAELNCGGHVLAPRGWKFVKG